MKGRPPEFLSNLFADLRDRGLLPIVGLLVVCLFAVPFLLGGGDDAATSGATGAAVASGDALPGIETRPVVIASPTELRDYQERLDSFSARNPFHQDVKKGGGNGNGSPDSTDTSISTTGGSTDPGVSSTNTADTTTPTDTAPSDIPTTPTGDQTTPTTPTETPPSDTGTKLISMRIDVLAGVAGKAKRIDDVRVLDFLPDPEHPVVEYVGATFDETKATFVVSSAIESTEGDGRCAPNPDNCQFLMLKVGQQQRFVYRGEEYRLDLLEINRHEQDVNPADVPAGKDSPSARGSVRNSFGAIDAG